MGLRIIELPVPLIYLDEKPAKPRPPEPEDNPHQPLTRDWVNWQLRAAGIDTAKLSYAEDLLPKSSSGS